MNENLAAACALLQTTTALTAVRKLLAEPLPLPRSKDGVVRTVALTLEIRAGRIEQRVEFVREASGTKYDRFRVEIDALDIKLLCHVSRNEAVDVTDFGATLAQYRYLVGDPRRTPIPRTDEEIAAVTGRLEGGRSVADAVLLMFLGQVWLLGLAEDGRGLAVAEQQRREG